MKQFDPFGGPGRFYKGNLHLHTRYSDGAFEPAEAAARYREAGYDFIAVTDHDRFYGGAQKLCGLTVLHGMEADGIVTDDPIRVHHFLTLALPGCTFKDGETVRELPPAYTDAEANGILCDLQAHGTLTALAHPNWSRVAFEQIEHLRGLWAVEIYNHASELEMLNGNSVDQWMQYLARGYRLYAVMTDDFHEAYHGFGGWVQVFAASDRPEDLLDGLQRGRFYASSGPEIHRLYIEDGVLHVTCSPCQRICFHTNHTWLNGKCDRRPQGTTLTTSCYPLENAIDYVVVSCTDAEGHTAFSQPLYADALPQCEKSV